MDNISIAIIAFLLGMLAQYLRGFIPTFNLNAVDEDIEDDVIHKDHLKPIHHKCIDGFSKINKCRGCGLTGLYYDLHETDACPRCGDKPKRYHSAKFMSYKGVKRWYSPEEVKNMEP